MVVLGLGILLGVFLGDLWMKNKIEAGFREKETPKKDGWIIIKKHHSRGAIMNFGETWGPGSGGRKICGRVTGQKLVTILSVLLCVLLTAVYIICLTKRGSGLLYLGLSFLLGGAFSNTYDRLKRKYVVDYFSFQTKWSRFNRIVFNISDFCIMIGAMLSIIGYMKE